MSKIDVSPDLLRWAIERNSRSLKIPNVASSPFIGGGLNGSILVFKSARKCVSWSQNLAEMIQKGAPKQPQ
ncbi:MAG: hypothetical protein OXE77_01425 [Flavobacteriaceae bacterium]|nr:hypothetical protein [Flavobacteriaceae bacterium]